MEFLSSTVGGDGFYEGLSNVIRKLNFGHKFGHFKGTGKKQMERVFFPAPSVF
jgi:hypothetical protein